MATAFQADPIAPQSDWQPLPERARLLLDVQQLLRQREHCVIGQRTALSDGDVDAVKQMYA